MSGVAATERISEWVDELECPSVCARVPSFHSKGAGSSACRNEDAAAAAAARSAGLSTQGRFALPPTSPAGLDDGAGRLPEGFGEVCAAWDSDVTADAAADAAADRAAHSAPDAATDGAADAATCSGAGGGGRCLYTGGVVGGDGSACAPPVVFDVASCLQTERHRVQMRAVAGTVGAIVLSFNGELTGEISIPYASQTDIAMKLSALPSVGTVNVFGLLNDDAPAEATSGSTRVDMVVEFAGTGDL